MTEAEWLACSDPQGVLSPLEDELPSRKLLLLGCACCRRKWMEVGDTFVRQLVVLAEHNADDRITEREMLRAFAGTRLPRTNNRALSNLRAAIHALGRLRHGNSAVRTLDLLRQVADASGFSVAETSLHHHQRSVLFSSGRERERTAQADLVRDIFGNPFRPVAFAPSRRTDTAVSLARQMYESREFAAMPILADALQDAGCDNDDVLNHCRGGGDHVRGCWVVDLILEMS